jgi:hypothetical protein
MYMCRKVGSKVKEEWKAKEGRKAGEWRRRADGRKGACVSDVLICDGAQEGRKSRKERKDGEGWMNGTR